MSAPGSNTNEGQYVRYYAGGQYGCGEPSQRPPLDTKASAALHTMVGIVEKFLGARYCIPMANCSTPIYLDF
jgi:hypothetical protein